jgi:hypothetical protein
MERGRMAGRSRRDYLRVMWQRYQRGDRTERSALLDEVTRVCGYHRKSVIRLFCRAMPPERRVRRVARRRPHYPAVVIERLAEIGAASGYLCAPRLKAALPVWLPWLKRRRTLTAAHEQALLAISPRQMDRRLQARKRTLARRLYGTTKPGTLLKQMVPIKTDHWDVRRPGYLEIDLVSHSGPCAAGDFLQTLDAVDIHTGWVERHAVMGKGQAGILQALRGFAARLPFVLRGLDSDNGSAFINAHMVADCQQQGLQFTRSRPYKKDDNAHVEQKNWTHVRKLVGWDRYDSQAAQQALNALYADLRIFQNGFQPSMKLQRKERRGSRLLRRYDAPRTPWARVQASPDADPVKVAALARVFATTDPFALAQRIDQHLERLAGLRSRAPQPRPQARTPWRGWTFRPRAQAFRERGAAKSTHTAASGATIGERPKGGVAPHQQLVACTRAR